MGRLLLLDGAFQLLFCCCIRRSKHITLYGYNDAIALFSVSSRESGRCYRSIRRHSKRSWSGVVAPLKVAISAKHNFAWQNAPGVPCANQSSLLIGNRTWWPSAPNHKENNKSQAQASHSFLISQKRI